MQLEYEFSRKYTFYEDLPGGRGATGKTQLVHDELLDQYFVRKEFTPYDESKRKDLFENFKREIKLLFKIHHRNIVRIFSFNLDEENSTGSFLMEFIEGQHVHEYLDECPEKINEVFEQTISGFQYLETPRPDSIIHRDIRPENLMVDKDGTVKIIDFGFGKSIKAAEDSYHSLNLERADLPEELKFGEEYDRQTEIFFIGRLFYKIIRDYRIETFNHELLLEKMCSIKRLYRPASFSEIVKHLSNSDPIERFSSQEIEAIRVFSNSLTEQMVSVESDATYNQDADKLLQQLETAYQDVMLLENIPDIKKVLRLFINGRFYSRRDGVPVQVLRSFIAEFRKMSSTNKRFALRNIQSSLEAFRDYSSDNDDNIPF